MPSLRPSEAESGIAAIPGEDREHDTESSPDATESGIAAIPGEDREHGTESSPDATESGIAAIPGEDREHDTESPPDATESGIAAILEEDREHDTESSPDATESGIAETTVADEIANQEGVLVQDVGSDAEVTGPVWIRAPMPGVMLAEPAYYSDADAVIDDGTVIAVIVAGAARASVTVCGGPVAITARYIEDGELVEYGEIIAQVEQIPGRD